MPWLPSCVPSVGSSRPSGAWWLERSVSAGDGMPPFASTPKPGHAGAPCATASSGIATPYGSNTAGGSAPSTGDCVRNMDDRLALLGPVRVIVGRPAGSASEPEPGRGEPNCAAMALFRSTCEVIEPRGEIEEDEDEFRGRPPRTHFNGRPRKLGVCFRAVSLGSQSSSTGRYAVGGGGGKVCVGNRLDGPGDWRPSGLAVMRWPLLEPDVPCPPEDVACPCPLEDPVCPWAEPLVCPCADEPAYASSSMERRLALLLPIPPDCPAG